MMNYSLYQLALFGFIEDNDGSAIVDAKAGSGKTTSIVEACNRIPGDLSVLFLAFNSSIVKELKNRLPTGVSCLTFNSCGWRSWIKYTGKTFRSVKIESKKTWKIIWDQLDEETWRMYGSFVNKMVGLAKSTGLTPDSPDSEWFKLQNHHNVLINTADADYDEGIKIAKYVLGYSINIAENVCDFDDQLYMPWLKNANFTKYDVVFIDEAQDTNPVQIALIRRMLNPGGRVIAVGDPNQAIYGFRGADHNAMNNIKEAFDCTTIPLSISYRCSKAIVAEAQKYVSDIEAFEDASEGKVEHLESYDINTFTVNDAVLCRNNSPLINFAYQAISRGKSINFLGRDIGGGLKTLIKNMEASNLDDLSVKLDAWLAKEEVKLRKKKQEDKMGILEDRVNCIEIFIRYLPQSRQTIVSLLSAIDELFKSKGRGITLSSVHKSKGKEFNSVYLVDSDIYMPSKYAKDRPWMMIQENNLFYVAVTRAKTYLAYISSDMWTDEPNLVIPERVRKAPKVKATKKGGMMGGFNPFSS